VESICKCSRSYITLLQVTIRLRSSPVKFDAARVDTWNVYRASLPDEPAPLRDREPIVVGCRSCLVLQAGLAEDLEGYRTRASEQTTWWKLADRKPALSATEATDESVCRAKTEERDGGEVTWRRDHQVLRRSVSSDWSQAHRRSNVHELHELCLCIDHQHQATRPRPHLTSHLLETTTWTCCLSHRPFTVPSSRRPNHTTPTMALNAYLNSPFCSPSAKYLLTLPRKSLRSNARRADHGRDAFQLRRQHEPGPRRRNRAHHTAGGGRRAERGSAAGAVYRAGR